MARNVYVTAMEPGSGKSAVVLGLTEVLSSARRVGWPSTGRSWLGASSPDTDIELIRHRYRLPQTYEESYGTAVDDLRAIRATAASYDALLKRVLDGYAAARRRRRRRGHRGQRLHRGVAGRSSWTSTSTWPTTWAARCCWWWAAATATAEQVLDAVHQGLGMLTERGCALLA